MIFERLVRKQRVGRHSVAAAKARAHADALAAAADYTSGTFAYVNGAYEHKRRRAGRYAEPEPKHAAADEGAQS